MFAPDLGQATQPRRPLWVRAVWEPARADGKPGRAGTTLAVSQARRFLLSRPHARGAAAAVGDPAVSWFSNSTEGTAGLATAAAVGGASDLVLFERSGRSRCRRCAG